MIRIVLIALFLVSCTFINVEDSSDIQVEVSIEPTESVPALLDLNIGRDSYSGVSQIQESGGN